MKLKNLQIINYRGIQELRLDFQDDMNVIYGINGVGKTSVLYALHDLFFLLNNSWISARCNTLADERIRIGSEETRILVSFLLDTGEEKHIEISRRRGDGCIPDKDFGIDWTKEKQLPSGIHVLGDVSDLSGKIKTQSYLPGFYNRKLIPVFPDGTMPMPVAPTFAVTRGIWDYDNFKKNFEDALSIERQEKEEQNNPSFQSARLKRFRETIQQLNHSFNGISIDFKQASHPIVVKKDMIWLDVASQLSSGEASVICMIGQICLGGPGIQETDTDIVLIDEIETSLHPDWQCQICSLLKETFPNTQFIVTSHSPFVWMNSDYKKVINLIVSDKDKVTVSPVKFARGSSLDEVVATFFQDSFKINPLADKEISKLENEIVEGEYSDELERKLNQLIDNFGELPALRELRFQLDLKKN